MIFASLFLSSLLLFQFGGVQFPALAVDEGALHIVWQDDREGNSEIYYSHANRGAAFSAARNISSTPGTSDLPRVSAHKNVVNIVWSDATVGMYQILLATSSDGGRTFAKPRVLSTGGGNAGPPDIATDEAGRIVVAWDEVQTDGTRRIMLWKDGAAARDIASGHGGVTPAVAVRGEKIVVAWHTDSLYDQHVYIAQSLDSGKAFSNSVLVSAKLERSITPSVSIGPDGRTSVAWTDQSTGKLAIFVSISDAAGRTYSDPKALPYSAREILFPIIQVAGADDASLVWTTRDVIVFARITSAGELKGPVRTLSMGSRVGQPRLVMDAGNPIIVWNESRAGKSEVVLSKDSRTGEPIF